MAKYRAHGEVTTVSSPFASALSLVAGATLPRRGKLIEFSWGARGGATAADVIMDMHIGRITAGGTGTAVNELPLDPADAASLIVGLEILTIEPTYTSNEELFQLGRHMRATYRWVAAPGAEFVLPATAAAGWGFRSEHASQGHIEQVMTIYDEL